MNRPKGGKGTSNNVTGVLGEVHLQRLPNMEGESAVT